MLRNLDQAVNTPIITTKMKVHSILLIQPVFKNHLIKEVDSVQINVVYVVVEVVVVCKEECSRLAKVLKIVIGIERIKSKNGDKEE